MQTNPLRAQCIVPQTFVNTVDQFAAVEETPSLSFSYRCIFSITASDNPVKKKVDISPCGILSPSWWEDKLIRIIFPWNEGLSWAGSETSLSVPWDPAWLCAFHILISPEKNAQQKTLKNPLNSRDQDLSALGLCLSVDTFQALMFLWIPVYTFWKCSFWLGLLSSKAWSQPCAHFNHILNLPLLPLPSITLNWKEGEKNPKQNKKPWHQLLISLPLSRLR